jgi:branched-chain amino acid transport system substrate-binding protein
MTEKKETTILLSALLLTGAIVMGIIQIFPNLIPGVLLYLDKTISQDSSKTDNNLKNSLDESISNGERILVNQDSYVEKKAGANAFIKGDFDLAQAKFKASLSKNQNDPEALIYLNNALAKKGNPVKIAVSVPIGGNVNVAKEILRGVAQAQNEINNKNGINNRLLQISIANDNNEARQASEIARKLTQDGKILAVVGHNASNASLAAAPEYQEGKLVMISPTSFAQNLSGFGDYILRTVPSINSTAQVLAEYITKKALKTNVAVCEDSKSIDNRKSVFVEAVQNAGAKVSTVECDLAADDFSPTAMISQIISSGADSLIILPHIDRIQKAIELTRANQGKLQLFSSPTMYTNQTLREGRTDVNGLILPGFWHPTAIPGNPFPGNARKLWGGNVSWRSAMAYDATIAIAQALKQAQTRQELKKVLRNENFSVGGATGEVKFSASGDREIKPILIKIQPSKNSQTGYDFFPLN